MGKIVIQDTVDQLAGVLREGLAFIEQTPKMSRSPGVFTVVHFA